LPQSYKALRRIRPQNSLRGERPKATTKYYEEKTFYLTHNITRITHALLSCACMTPVMYPNCTYAPPTGKDTTREIQNPHHASTADSQGDTKLGRHRENRRKDKATTSREDPKQRPKGETPRQPHGTHTEEGATELQGPWLRPQEQNIINKNHGLKRQRTTANCTDTIGKSRAR